jgi:opacity protein-like surface antigen
MQHRTGKWRKTAKKNGLVRREVRKIKPVSKLRNGESKMVRTSLLSGAAALAAAVFFIAAPVSAADIAVEPEPVAENNWYVSIHGGIKFGEDWDDTFFKKCDTHCEEEWDVTGDTDNGWRFGGAVGVMFSEIFALEGEVAYMKQDFDELTINAIDGYAKGWEWDLDGDVAIWTGMVNLIAGVPVGGIFRPYVGVGGGFAHVSLNDVFDGFLDDNDTSFALQGFAGLDVGLTENVALGIRGRIVHIGDLEFEDEDDCDHDVEVDLLKSVEAVLTVGF